MNKVYHNDQEFLFPDNVISVSTTDSGLEVTTESGQFRIIDTDCGSYAMAK